MYFKAYFKAFFGIRPEQVRETLILSPIIYPKQFEKIIGQKGKHCKSILSYLVANFKHLTFVKTPMTQSAVADLVALLAKTSCKKIIFVGAIGALQQGVKIGDLVVSEKAKDIYSFKSIHDETKGKLVALRKKGVLGIDFESRAFFSAAKKVKIPAIAYYVVTDLPLSKPFYVKKTRREKNRIQDSLEEIIHYSPSPSSMERGRSLKLWRG